MYQALGNHRGDAPARGHDGMDQRAGDPCLAGAHLVGQDRARCVAKPIGDPVKSQSLCECVTGEHRESAVVQAAAAAA